MVDGKVNAKFEDRQKSYENKGITFRESQVGEHLFLKVMGKKISLKLGSCKKLEARYSRPFDILSRIGLISLIKDKGV